LTVKVYQKANAWRDEGHLDRQMDILRVLLGEKPMSDLTSSSRKRVERVGEEVLAFAEKGVTNPLQLRQLIVRWYQYGKLFSDSTVFADTIGYLEGMYPAPNGHHERMEAVGTGYQKEKGLIQTFLYGELLKTRDEVMAQVENWIKGLTQNPNSQGWRRWTLKKIVYGTDDFEPDSVTRYLQFRWPEDWKSPVGLWDSFCSYLQSNKINLCHLLLLLDPPTEPLSEPVEPQRIAKNSGPRTETIAVGPRNNAHLYYGRDARDTPQFVTTPVDVVFADLPRLGTQDYGGGDREIGSEDHPDKYILSCADAIEASMTTAKKTATLIVRMKDAVNGSKMSGGTSSRSGTGRSQPHNDYRAYDSELPRGALMDLPGKLIAELRRRSLFLTREWFSLTPNGLGHPHRRRDVERILCFTGSNVRFNPVATEYEEDGVVKLGTRPNYLRAPKSPNKGLHPAVTPTGLAKWCLEWVLPVGCCPHCGAPWVCKEKFVHYSGSKWVPGCDCENNTAKNRMPSIVLDPFSGSGTTGAAATQMGADYIGIELQMDYLDEAISKIQGIKPLTTETKGTKRGQDLVSMMASPAQ